MSNTKKIYKKIVCLLTAVVLLVGGIVGKNIYDIMADTSFEQTLKSFPESYRPSYRHCMINILTGLLKRSIQDLTGMKCLRTRHC